MSVVQSSFQAWNIVGLGRGGLVFVNCCCGLITQKILEWCQIQRVHASIVMLEDCLDSVTGKSLQAFVQPWGQEEKVKISQIEIERKRRQWMLSICFMNEATLGLTKENKLKRSRHLQFFAHWNNRINLHWHRGCVFWENPNSDVTIYLFFFLEEK